MQAADILRALVYPVVTPAVLIPALVFWLLLALAFWGGLLGLFLLFLVVPAVLRFLMIVLEARARGAEPATPDVEFFNWFGNAWTLFPVPVVVALAWATLAAATALESAWPMLLVSSLFLPPFLSVLAVTRSPLQSLNPIALWRLLRACAASLWVASAFMLFAGWAALRIGNLPLQIDLLLQLLLAFACMSLLGSLLEPYQLMDEVDIPEPLEKGPLELAAGLEAKRRAVINHAYGFASRGNRDGGFRHIFAAIDEDPDPAGAWAWYFARMLRWEQSMPAMFFAQHYVHDLLLHGEEIPALKVILRCQHIDADFKPLPEDIDRAIRAADSSGNIELATVLRRM